MCTAVPCRRYRGGESEEVVVVSLLHDITETVSYKNHGIASHNPFSDSPAAVHHTRRAAVHTIYTMSCITRGIIVFICVRIVDNVRTKSPPLCSAATQAEHGRTYPMQGHTLCVAA